MTTGRVVRFDSARGYGFISPDNGDEDVFLHVNDLLIPESYLRPGLAVEFDVEDGGRGLKAANITLAAGATAPPQHPAPPAPAGALSPAFLPGATPTPRPVPAPAPSKQTTKRQSTEAEEPLADVLSADEHTREVTELLLRVTDLTSRQIVEIRQSLLQFAKGHGWVDG